MGDPESNPASFLGAELRRARVAAGFSSQEALAAKLGYDRSVIAKAETGERPPSPEVADALQAELFPAGPDGLVIRLATLARRADGPIPSWFESWLEAERAAHMLRLWSPLLVPGLLQTANDRRSTRPSPGSRPPTPTRTNATTNPSSTPSPQDGSPPNATCDIGTGPPGDRAR
jgi:transcriptional regulator with XRE-family HTH domain